MKTFSLKADLREQIGKKSSKELRKQDLIPANVYGISDKNLNIVVSQEAVRKLVYSPDIYLIDLEVNGEVRKCIIKELQFHPVTDRILHMDFLEVKQDKPIVIEVPVVLDGFAAGVRAGGKLSLEMRKLRVRGLYDNVPEKLHIDVTKLKLGKTIQVGALSFENLEILNAKNAVVAAVRLTRAARGAAAAAAAAGDDDEDTDDAASEAEE